MPFVVPIIGVILSSLIFRVLASVSFGIVTASFINRVINDYIIRSLVMMTTNVNDDVMAMLNILRADECLSIMIGGLTFVSIYKSLKFVFVRG